MSDIAGFDLEDKDILGWSLRFWLRNIQPIILLSLVFLPYDAWLEYLSHEDHLYWNYFLTLIEMPVVGAAHTLLISDLDQRQAISLRGIMGRAFGLYADFMAFTLLMYLMVFLPIGIFYWATHSGFLFLIFFILIWLPSVLWGSQKLSMAPYFMALRDDRPVVAIRRSYQITGGHGWLIFGYGAAVFMPSLLIGMGLGYATKDQGWLMGTAVNFVTTILMMLLTVVMYRIFVLLTQGPSPDEELKPEIPL